MSPENEWLKDVFACKSVPFKGDMLVLRDVDRLSQGQVSQLRQLRQHPGLTLTRQQARPWQSFPRDNRLKYGHILEDVYIF